MNVENESAMVSRNEYDELLQKLKAAETENNKLARELRTEAKRNEIYKLNFETQSSLNKTITDEKLKQEMYVRLLLESCPDIMFIFDEKTKFLLGTNSVANIIDIDDVSILQGRELDSILERYHPPAFTEELVASLKSIIDIHDKQRVKKKLEAATENSRYEVNILSFHKDTGEFAGVLTVMHDITELIKARETAVQASLAKSQFLSRMSHEMRTPMNAIIGMTSIAKGSNDPEKKEYCLEKIDGASKHLLGLINDILDMAKIEADKFELSCHEFNFEKMLMSVINVVNFSIEEKQQNLIINLSKNIPFSIVSDELRLTQVITNLLTNAIKFTPEGGAIMLNTSVLSEADGKTKLQIEIIDNGIGISEEQQSRLFTSFEQADGGIARKYGGTGLGLAISKRIVELMGGEIWIESEMGKGSKFLFTINVEKGAGILHPKLKINKADMRILAVDDSPETRAYFVQLFDAFELPCDVAADGFEALSMLQRRMDKPYNIFFVDWQMPGMDGIELTRKIKAAAAHAQIIMISAAEWSDIEEAALAAGVNRFIPKPLFPSILMNAISESLAAGKDSRTPASTAVRGVPDYRRHTLLLAEDVEINREIIAAILEDTGVTIDYAENGLEALARFTAEPQRYSLILMDIHMPEMDGYEATRRIRALGCPEAKAVPIIAMTANVFKEDVENCLAAGMNSHLGKPVDTDELFKTLGQYLV